MKLSRKILCAALILLAAAGTVFGGGRQAQTFPAKDITLIVPWNPGGSSDLIGRLLAADMEKTLGVKITVVNTPGATGTVGMNDCFLKPHDGYTLIANATPYTHGILGLANWKPADWSFLGAYYVPGIIAVNKNSPYKTIKQLVDAIAANPGKITGGTAGVGSSGFVNMEVLKSAIPELKNYEHISYSGGAPAVTATLAGEVVFTPQLSNEMIDLLRSGDLIALATLTVDDLKLDGVSYTIPSIKNAYPAAAKILPCGDAFGLLFPSDVPQETQKILESAYLKACQTEAAKKFAAEKGVVLQAMTLDESNALTIADAKLKGWILYDSGAAPKPPADFGIPRP
ncbi:MAG: tripartite tricarboxylate transporter substrate binding protein [Spirochaetales bacterium]|jgi:tripartite-type tricarboxylate transporter receptor subunit TctC|nr:tripartite tricarboxylate transporter substrate binding protein [Spirochaetales bacterium]